MDMLNAIELYVMCVTPAIPVAFVFAMGNLLVGTVLRTAFGGKLEFKI